MMDVFSTLVVMMVSWMYVEPITVQTLNVSSLLLINYNSIKLKQMHYVV